MMKKEEWKRMQLGNISEIKNGYTPSKNLLSKTGEYPYFKVADMNHECNSVFLEITTSYIDKPKIFFPTGCIVFPKNGAAIATNKKRILSQNSVVDLNTSVVKPLKGINNKFLFYWFLNLDFRNYTRGGAVPTLDIRTLKTLPIPLPPLPIQNNIVAELDALNDIINIKKQQLEELDKLAEATFYDMFGDPVENEKGWEVKKFKSICEIRSGKNQKQVEDNNGKYPIIGSGGIMGYANDYICPANTVVLGRKGTINRPFLMKNKFWNVDTAFGLIANDKDIASCYLYYFCKMFDFMRLNVAVTIPSLRKVDINEIDIPTPPLPLQTQFAKKIEHIENQKSLIQGSIDDVQQLFDYTMDKYFS